MIIFRFVFRLLGLDYERRVTTRGAAGVRWYEWLLAALGAYVAFRWLWRVLF